MKKNKNTAENGFCQKNLEMCRYIVLRQASDVHLNDELVYVQSMDDSEQNV